MQRDAVRFDRVVRRFGGFEVLRELSFSVPVGSVTALLGRNGAGKSTALRCLVGLLRVHGGRCFLLGNDVRHADIHVRAKVGFLSDNGSLDAQLTVAEMLDYNAAFFPRRDEVLEADLLDRLQLWPRAMISALSKGQSRKLGLVLALASRPELLILDEPAANLDVVVRREFLDVVLDLLRSEGMTVLLSTHLLGDVERVADRVALIEDGVLQIESDLDDLKERVKALRLVARHGDRISDDISVEGELRRQRSGRELLVTTDQFSLRLVERLTTAHALDVHVRDLPLEDIFLAYAQQATL